MDKILTDIDKADLLEGIKKRPPHVFKGTPKRTSEEKLIDFIVENGGDIDLRSTAKKFEKTTTEVLNIINELGYY